MLRMLLPAAVAASPLVIIIVILSVTRCGDEFEPTAGLTAEAALTSPDGADIGTVTFLQTANGVLIRADVEGLTPGGHAFIIHEVGACSPGFDAAGDHFNPTGEDHGFVHSTWRRGDSGGHGGDLLNIYAAADGTARADFLTGGVTLDTGEPHSVFDEDGSAIIVHEHPDAYAEEESDTGTRLACGVIVPTDTGG